VARKALDVKGRGISRALSHLLIMNLDWSIRSITKKGKASEQCAWPCRERVLESIPEYPAKLLLRFECVRKMTDIGDNVIDSER
jgi:hypothetical protein